MAAAALDSVRAGVRDLLVDTPEYRALPPEQRRTIANSLVRIAHAASTIAAEVEQAPVAETMAVPARAMNAGSELSGRAVASVADTTRNVMNAISFPRFVNELINGVFKAILEANQQQLTQYVELVRGVSQSLDGFAEIGGSDAAARRWLVDRFPASFALEEPDPDEGPPDPDDPPDPPRLRTIGSLPSEAALRAAFGLEPTDELPSGGAEALVPFTRRMLARNRQQMLSSMVMMGMQRIVIDSGRIHAAMRFHIDARSAAQEDRGSQFDTRHEIGAKGSVGFGWWSAEASMKSSIGYVSTQNVSTTEELNTSADVSSSVELQFRTDQVPLDRIAAGNTVERLRLNSLNPERELQIAAETDRARIAARQATDTVRAARPAPAAAPSSTIQVREPAVPRPPGSSGGAAPGGSTAGTSGAARAPTASPGVGSPPGSQQVGLPAAGNRSAAAPNSGGGETAGAGARRSVPPPGATRRS